MKFLPLVWSNLKRKKLRTLLTLMSILVAFLLYGYLSAVKKAFQAGVDVTGADRLIVRHKVSIIQLLPVSYKERIKQIPGVVEVTHATWFSGIYKDVKNFFPQFPVEPEAYLSMYPEIVLPADAKKAWLGDRMAAVVGKTTAQKYGWKVGDRIPIQATIWIQRGGGRTWEFNLAGIYDGKKKEDDTTTFLFRYDYFDEARAFAKGFVGWYIIRIADPAHAAEVVRKVDAEFANSPHETKTETEKAFVQAFAKQVGDIGAILVAILSAVFFTMLLVAGNTMAQAVRERIGEMAALKAMGFSDGRLMGLVLAESCLLALLGGGLGLALAWVIISQGDPTRGAFPVFFFPGKDILIGVGLVILVGLASGILPALQAMRLRIADAMRRM